MGVLKKFLALMLMALMISGCGSDKSEESKPAPKTETTATQPKETPPPAPKSNVKLYGNDLEISQDEFIALYNASLDKLASNDGKNFDDRKITFDNPKNVEKSKKGTAIHFYSGKYCTVSLHKNTSSAGAICGVSLTTKAGRKATELLPEITATIFTVTQGQGDYSNIADVVGTFMNSGNLGASAVDGLLIKYNPDVGLMIFAEDATIDDGLGNRVVDNIKKDIR